MSAPVRPNVLQMEPYAPGKPIAEVKRELGLDRVVKLASNENPYGPSPLAIQAVERAAREMHIYPDGAAYNLKQAVADKFGIPAANVMVGNGSDELIHLLGLMFLNEGDEVIVGDPSFVRYDAAAQLAPAKLVKVPLDADLRHDLPAMARAVTDRTKMLFIANPNNPTGTVVTREEVDRLMADVPDHVVVILDEAYYEFAQHLPEYPVSLDYVRQGRNVVGLRTFSKAYGLAGVRLGYGFAPEAIVDAYQRAREPFNVNSLAQAAGVAALQDDEHVRKTVENNRRGLERLAGVFTSLGAKPIDSFANFAYADMGAPADPIFRALLQRGVIVRAGSHVGHPNCLRVSVGTEEEMQIFENELRAVVPQAVTA
jgi:histidinol-phosphate aminotransferase